MPPKRKSSQASRGRRGRPRVEGRSFIETEAQEEGSRGEEQSEADSREETDDGEGETQQRSFIDDSSPLSGNSPSAHRALDSLRREQESIQEEDVRQLPTAIAGTSSSSDLGLETQPLHPYFPAGLAKSVEQLTEFNFEMFLFDTLKLPRGLFPEDESQQVEFENLDECRQYCERYVADREEWCRQQQPCTDQTHEMRSRLSKQTMFQQAGSPLAPFMITGNATFDYHLDKLRIDIFGNVMFLRAPSWSDISAQFTHGYPRRLINESHGGILSGNITVAARISNQAIRSLSTGDIAAFISRGMLRGLGLTPAELMLARASAIRYAGKQHKPARLIDLMLRFGLDFLDITPLNAEQIQGLRTSSSTYWNELLTSTSESDLVESESSSDESEITVSWDPRNECVSIPPPTSSDHAVAVRRHVENLVFWYVSRPSVTTEVEPRAEAEVAAQRRPSGSSGLHRRKRTTPRRVVPSTSQTSDTASAGEEPQEAREDQEVSQPVLRNPREALLSLPGIAATRIPSEDSLGRLEQFLRENQPCDPGQVESSATEAGRLAASRFRYQQLRSQSVVKGVGDVWQGCKSDCVCFAEPITRSSQDDQRDENCPYCIQDGEGGDMGTVTTSCENSDCRVCVLMNKLDRPTLVALGMKKNERLTAMMELAPSIAHQLNSGVIPEDRRQILVTAFCNLLSCSKSRLRNVANVGFLAMLCPRLRYLNLERGWGDVWSNLSKMATAVGYHADQRSQVAALIYLRRRSIPDTNNRWHWFLQTQGTEEETITQEVFAGCFQDEQADTPGEGGQ